MLEEGFAPVTTHRSGVEVVLLGRKVCRDEGEDFQRDAIDANEGVLQFANSCQRCRGILVESRNLVRGEAAKEVRNPFFGESGITTYAEEDATRFNSSLRAKKSCESERPFPG